MLVWDHVADKEYANKQLSCCGIEVRMLVICRSHERAVEVTKVLGGQLGDC